MFYIFMSCIIGIGILNLILGKIMSGIVEKFRIENNLTKRKFSLLKRIVNIIMRYIVCFSPIVQIFTTIILVIISILYSYNDDEIKENLIKNWKQ